MTTTLVLKETPSRQMTICDLVHSAYVKNLELSANEMRPLLRTLHQRRLWKSLQVTFSKCSDEESLATKCVLPESFLQYNAQRETRSQVKHNDDTSLDGVDDQPTNFDITIKEDTDSDFQQCELIRVAQPVAQTHPFATASLKDDGRVVPHQPAYTLPTQYVW
eukprot:gene1439-4599_t